MKIVQPMRDQQQLVDASWSVDAGRVRTLQIGPGPRVLRVSEGPLWITVSGTPDNPPQDLWLEKGEAVTLESGAEIVVEGWPVARFELVVPPAACAGVRTPFSAWLLRHHSAWRDALRRLSPALAS